MKERSERAVPQDERESLDPDALFTFGADRGLLLGDRLGEGDVQGLTILVTFPGTDTTVTPADVDAMLNGPDYHANGNHCSVREFFRAMSSERLRFGNTVVGPFRMSRSRLTHANNEGLLAPRRSRRRWTPAFLLTQNLDQLEALDLDEFRVFQINLGEPEERTHLRFPVALRKADTLAAPEAMADRRPLDTPADIRWS
ncbi:hypothetical protein GCM10010495_58620 [Kitasatospora herbaricolor]|uniref:hypothetical protein n=1 Tax=Kitasatospora herbaricolor TaxID=68217 RepID=UPI00174AA594|nr:hypothetical protein [Kitasatospora herbaricolor]MDQ0306617.1 hypothetical protein [Kitasatospora herbaricolor]GGV33987.1 hypothetical protein GCM10010495_58620 [Kitasatospora herbaricolor]